MKMSIFKRKARVDREISFDPSHMEAILKCNTCNSEQVLKLKDITTGETTEIAYIRYEHELREYMDRYGITDIKKVY